ncbi:MAG: hypothetical protein QXJ31_05190 [Candidatus Bathyarchaeia archaeon]
MPVETRHMRGDQQTVNGLTAYILGLTQSAIEKHYSLINDASSYIYAGIRVWKRSADGVETEITGGSPVAVAYVYYPRGGGGYASATWGCPQTPLNPTDAIVVRVYARKSTTATWELAATFITEQLGATQLDAATWTVYYYLTVIYDATLKVVIEDTFDWGTSGWDSRIEGFSWSVPPPPAAAKIAYTDGLVCIA